MYSKRYFISRCKGGKPRKGSDWRFDGSFPDEDAATGIGGSIYTGTSAYLG
jgi:hypothetical protein